MSASSSSAIDEGLSSTASAIFDRSWRGDPAPVSHDTLGPAGPDATGDEHGLDRDELRRLASQLQGSRRIITDWPGFGDAPRPPVDYDRALCRAFLEALVAHLRSEFDRPSFPVLACGHASHHDEWEGRSILASGNSSMLRSSASCSTDSTSHGRSSA